MNKTVQRNISSILVVNLLAILLCINTFALGSLTMNVNLYEGGRIDVNGVISTGSDKQLTFLVIEDGLPVTGENIIYIDQQASTTNGTYLFRFTVPVAKRGHTLEFKIGSTEAPTISKQLVIPDFPINIGSVENNSVRVGIDVYQMQSTYYVVNNVIDSLKQGGNTIYYKIGDNWYDLLNTNARSSAWLVPTNAVNTTIVTEWLLDMWYPRGGFATMKFDPLPLSEITPQ